MTKDDQNHKLASDQVGYSSIEVPPVDETTVTADVLANAIACIESFQAEIEHVKKEMLKLQQKLGRPNDD